MTWPPKGARWVYDKGPLPAGAKLKPVDDHILLRYRGPKRVDRLEILGLIVGENRRLLGVALTQQDSEVRLDSDYAILEPSGVVAQGVKHWPNEAAWLAEIDAPKT